MEQLEKDYPQFKFIPVLSRDNEGWTGRKGYVHQVYEEILPINVQQSFYLWLG